MVTATMIMNTGRGGLALIPRINEPFAIVWALAKEH